MLANLTSLIWGSEEVPTTSATEESAKSTNSDVSARKEEGSHNVRACTPEDEEESDWVLVDRAEVDEASRILENDPPQWMLETSAAATSITTTIPVPTSSPVLCSGETSDGGPQEWLVTPPPCFTRSQGAPIASSPLEDLLIEHPSMSVYLPRPTYTNAANARIFPRRLMSHSSPSSRSTHSASPSSLPASGDREESPMREDLIREADEREQQVDHARPNGRPAGVTQRTASLMQALDVLRPAQKAQRRRDERRLKHKHLERNNKVREVASAGNKRSKRCDLLTPSKFSRAVNNRKC